VLWDARKAYGREIEHGIRRSLTRITKIEFFPAFYAAHQATITESNIKGGFRGAGFVPFDPESVISRLDVQLRTPTPPEEDTGRAQPWTPKTPKTVNEADSHSEYLQRRIRGHKSSSPACIIEAIKFDTQALKEHMHEIAYFGLKSEIFEKEIQHLAGIKGKKEHGYRIAAR
jgi:hypothetical protein